MFEPVADDGVRDPAGAGAAPVGPVESAVRLLAAGSAAGALVGVLIGGVGGRLAMGVLASLNPEDQGVISDDGFRIGQITVGGTAQLLGGTLQFGLIGAVIYLALRNLAIGPQWLRIASLTLGGTVVFGALLIHDGVDFTTLEPTGLAIAMFLGIPLIYIPVVALLIERWLRPTSWFMTADRRLVATVFLLWIGVLLPLLAISFVVVVAGRTNIIDLSTAGRAVGAWMIRIVLGVVGVVALLDLASDINTFA